MCRTKQSRVASEEQLAIGSLTVVNLGDPVDIESNEMKALIQEVSKEAHEDWQMCLLKLFTHSVIFENELLNVPQEALVDPVSHYGHLMAFNVNL